VGEPCCLLPSHATAASPQKAGHREGGGEPQRCLGGCQRLEAIGRGAGTRQRRSLVQPFGSAPGVRTLSLCSSSGTAADVAHTERERTSAREGGDFPKRKPPRPPLISMPFSSQVAGRPGTAQGLREQLPGPSHRTSCLDVTSPG